MECAQDGFGSIQQIDLLDFRGRCPSRVNRYRKDNVFFIISAAGGKPPASRSLGRQVHGHLGAPVWQYFIPDVTTMRLHNGLRDAQAESAALDGAVV